MKIPTSIKNLADALEGLPGIGPRQAIRIALHIASQDPERLGRLATTIIEVHKTRICPKCFHVYDTQTDVCEVCINPERDNRTIAIIEKETDLISLETSGRFNGHYLVIGSIKKAGALEEMQKIRLSKLKDRISDEMEGIADEIIIALNPTTYGDISTGIITREVSAYTKKVTRLGRGIPIGGEIEFADFETLSEALKNRG